MTNYHALVAQIRQRLEEHGGKRPSLDLIDLTTGSFDDALSWARQLQIMLAETGSVNLVRTGVYGALPAAPVSWQGPWLRDLPGVQRLYEADGSLTLTVLISRVFLTPAQLLQTMACRTDIVLVDRFEPDLAQYLPRGGWVWNRSTQQALWFDPQPNSASPELASWMVPTPVVRGASIMVVGAGIAGLTTAYTLVQRGFNVTVIDAASPLGTQGVHQGHLAAALTPVVSADDNVRSRLSRAGALRADQLWRQLPTEIGTACGALQLEKPLDQRRRVDLEQVAKTLDLPSWAIWQTAEQASQRAGMRLARGGLWLPGGWLIQVERLLSVLAQTAGLSLVSAQVQRIEQQAGVWHAIDQAGHVIVSAHAVVLANAADVPSLLIRSSLQRNELNRGDLSSIPAEIAPISDSIDSLGRLDGLHRLCGEITAIPAQMLANGPTCIVGGDGYVLPAVDGWCISGGTYVRGVEQAAPSVQGKQDNWARAMQLLSLPDVPEKRHGQDWSVASLPGWAGWRAVVAGRLPVVGPMLKRNGLYVCTAGASRGLTWSALQAQLLADHLEGRSPALERALLAQISLI